MFARKPPLRSVGTDPTTASHWPTSGPFWPGCGRGLALLAGAVALASLVHDFGPRPFRIVITVLLLVLSLIVTAGAYVRWDGAERAMREKRPLPTDPLPPRIIVSGAAIIIVAAAVLVYLAEFGR